MNSMLLFSACLLNVGSKNLQCLDTITTTFIIDYSVQYGKMNINGKFRRRYRRTIKARRFLNEHKKGAFR
jgi:hypothetical protein